MDTIDVRGRVPPQFMEALLRLPDKARIQRTVNKGAHIVQRAAKVHASNQFESPGIERSIIVLPHPERLSAQVGSTHIAGRAHELGAHIVPVHKQWLSWWVTDAVKGGYKSFAAAARSKKGIEANLGATSHRVFAKHVDLPPRPYLVPGLEESEAEIAGEFGEMCREVFGVIPEEMS